MTKQQEKPRKGPAIGPKSEPPAGPLTQTTTALPPNKNSGGVAAVDRALSILHAFRVGGPSLSLTEIAKMTGFNKSTILRLNQSLERFEYLVRGSDRRYRIGPSAWRLGILFQRELRLEDRVLPLLQELAVQTSETVAFWIPLLNYESPMRICFLRIESEHEVAHNFKVGDTMTLVGADEEKLGTAGRVMRAFLFPEHERDEFIRQARVFSSCAVRDPDVLGVAAPVFNSSDELVGVVSLSAPTSRRDSEWAKSQETRVLSTAEKATLALGGELKSCLGVI